MNVAFRATYKCAYLLTKPEDVLQCHFVQNQNVQLLIASKTF